MSQEWIAADPRNAEVLFPYLNGDDLNSRPDSSASRWVIDFTGLSEVEARTRHPVLFEHLERRVKPERMRQSKAVRESPWWQFLRTRPAMRRAIDGLSEVLVIAVVSKTVMPLRVPTGQVFSNKLDVFATDSYSDQALLSSSLHQMWAIKFGATMRADTAYTPSTVFETFPRSRANARLERWGEELSCYRNALMRRRRLGLTTLYNMVNDRSLANTSDPEVERLREIHMELDKSVAAAHGWEDLLLDHGFHSYRQVTRWTVSPAARAELFDRLLEENRHRAQDSQA